jgi:Fe-S-cluster containining protein
VDEHLRVDSLESELERARDLSVAELADAIETIGFECTHCGACCKAADCGDNQEGDGQREDNDVEEHTATVFPDEVRQLQDDEYDWRDVARPMPYGLSEGDDGPVGETFEWALQTDECGDCTFYDADRARCTVHSDRPLICQTYPFSVGLGGTSQPMGEAVDSEGMVRAHECEGLGRDISREEAEELAGALKKRAIRELEEAISVRDNYEPVESEGVVVYDSEGPKRPDGTSY